MMEEQVILVDHQDNELGQMGKLEVHEKGLLHRAFSIFIFNETGQLLIHQRAAGKYHCPGRWTNTCCSHPRPGEEIQDAAARRLVEEMGFSAEIQPLFSFVYHADVGGGLVEHELDHVFIGRYEGVVAPDPSEVSDFKYVDMDDLIQDVKQGPDRYTPWFRVCLPQVTELLARWAA